MAPLGFIQNFGPWEWLIVLAIILILFGHRLPGVGRALGRSVGEFKSGIKEGQEEARKAEEGASKPDAKQGKT